MLFDPAWAVVYATLLGSVATVASVVGAILAYRRNERRRLIDSLRVEAETARGLFERIDRSLSSATFMLASEEFRKRVDDLVGNEKTNLRLSQLLLIDKIHINIRRLLNQSIQSTSTVSDINQNLQRMREAAIRVGQIYPASSYLILKLMSVLEQTVMVWTSGRIYEDIDMELLKSRSEQIAKSTSPYEVELEDFSSILDYFPGEFLSAGRQKNIDDAKEIMGIVSRLLSQASDATLMKLARHERASKIEEYEDHQYVAQSIEAVLKANRQYFSASDWDQLWEARTRLIDSTTPKGRS